MSVPRTGPQGMRAPERLAWLALLSLACVGCGTTAADAPQAGLKVLRIPMVSDGPKTFDPVRGSTHYENIAVSQVYETLLQYKYLVRPYELEPLLLAEMPTVSDDGRVYRFRLKQGVYFHDDPCFPGGKGRELTASDVIYSWKRIADENNRPKAWWIVRGTIKGFDEYRERQNRAAENGGRFDYDAPVDGLRILGRYEFEVELVKPIQRFLWTLAMFQLSVVPREAVEYYGERFNRHPVGTGPFILESWIAKKRIVFRRNPNYHACRYPTEHEPEDVAAGLTAAAGRRIPFVDRIEISMFAESQPMWLKFRAGELDFTTVPSEYYPQAFVTRKRRLRPSYRKRGIQAHHVPLLDFIFIGFNMEDPVVGGYSQRQKDLRHALSLALDWEERNRAFYNGTCVIYDGPIPPGLDGHPPAGRAPVSYRGPDLARARELLARAGYPNGEGLPEIEYYTSRGGNNDQQTEMTARQLARIGVRLKRRLVDFSKLMEAVDSKGAPMFGFAWGSDYPDAENNLALFYGPNESPGANHFNYKNEEYDRLYERILTMPPSPERTRIYERMRDMLIEDAPFLGSMARTRVYLNHARLKNFKPAETFSNWYKYLDIEPTVAARSFAKSD